MDCTRPDTTPNIEASVKGVWGPDSYNIDDLRPSLTVSGETLRDYTGVTNQPRLPTWRKV